MGMKEFIESANKFGWWNMFLSSWTVFSFRVSWAVKNYGLISAMWRGFQRIASPVIQIDLLYKNQIDVTGASREKLDEIGPALPFRDLDLAEVYEKKHYFGELKLAHMRERSSRGIKIFCLLSEDESEILGYIHWIPRSLFDDNMLRMIELKPDSVYGVELSVNIKHRGLKLGTYIQHALALHLKELGYNYMFTITRFDNLQSLAVQKSVGMKTVRKYFRFYLNLGALIPLGRDLSYMTRGK